MKTFLVLLATLLIPTTATATDVWLSPGADVRQAMMAAHPGDRVLLHAGTYTGGGWIGPLHGTAAAPIQLLSGDGPRAARLVGGGEVLRIGDGSSYLVIDGLEITGTANDNNLVHLDGHCHHITLSNLNVHDAGFDGDVVKVNQCHDITVRGSELARPGARADTSGGNPYQECIDFLAVDNAIIEDNWIHDAGSMAGFVKGGSHNAIIQRNLITGQRAGASDPLFGLGGSSDSNLLGSNRYEAFSILFRNNIVQGGVVGALGIYDASGAYVVNNLFLDNAGPAVLQARAGNGPAHASRDVRFENNLIVDTRGRMPVPLARLSDGLSGLVLQSNLFWNAGAAVPASPVANLPATPGYLAADPGVHAVPANANYAAIVAAARPSASGPALATGANASAAPFLVTDDFTGAARSAVWDRGPFTLSESSSPARFHRH